MPLRNGKYVVYYEPGELQEWMNLQAILIGRMIEKYPQEVSGLLTKEEIAIYGKYRIKNKSVRDEELQGIEKATKKKHG